MPALKQPDRVTDDDAAKMCCVSVAMIRLWVETGVWPMPRRDVTAPSTYGHSEVEAWLATGIWPPGAHFRARPEY